MVETDASVAAALVHAHMWDPLVIASPCNRSTPLPLAPIWLPSRCLYPHSVAGWRRAKVPVPGPAADDTARVDLPCRLPSARLADGSSKISFLLAKLGGVQLGLRRLPARLG